MATLKGIWVFNDNPPMSFSGSHFDVNFTSNNSSYTRMGFDEDSHSFGVISLYYDAIEAYTYGSYMNGWIDAAYKTVDFGTTEQTVDDTFYTWLTANATQQASEEEEPITSGVTVEYNDEVIATIPSGNKATIPVADKKMKSDIVITVPEAEGEVLPEFTEVEDFAVLANGADEGSLELAYSVSQDVKLSAASPAPLVSIDDANFIANNIKKDVSIFGLTGAYEATDSPLPTEVSTEAEMTALLESGEVGGVYKYTGTTGTYENGALYVLENATITFTINGTSYQAEEGMTWLQWCNSNYNTGGFVVNGNSIRDSNGGYVALNGNPVVTSDTVLNNSSYLIQYSGGGVN